MKQKLVVIGAGMASGRVLEHLLEQDREAYDITLFNAEARGNYNRIMLTFRIKNAAPIKIIVWLCVFDRACP